MNSTSKKSHPKGLRGSSKASSDRILKSLSTISKRGNVTLLRRFMEPLYLVRSLSRSKPVRALINTLLLALSLLLLASTLAGRYIEAQTGTPASLLGLKPVVVMSGSMEPAIRTDSLALVLRTDRYKEGDILMFQRDRRPDTQESSKASSAPSVLHRLLRMEPDGSLITKGDANQAPDPSRVDPSEVYGKVILRMNWTAGIIRAIRTIREGDHIPYPKAAFLTPVRCEPDTETKPAVDPKAVSRLPEVPFFADTEHDQGNCWNYILHTHRSDILKQTHYIPMILLLSWIPLLIASIVAIRIYITEDTTTRGFAGGVSGEIEEVFDPKDASGLLPRQAFPKEVTLRSTSDIPTRVYIRLEIPVAEDRTGTSDYRLIDALIPEINKEDFQLVSSAKGRTAGSCSTYLYRYRKPLDPGEETTPLFKTVQVPDFKSITDLSDVISISGYLIQWDHIPAKDADKRARAWSRLTSHTEGTYIDTIETAGTITYNDEEGQSRQSEEYSIRKEISYEYHDQPGISCPEQL